MRKKKKQARAPAAESLLKPAGTVVISPKPSPSPGPPDLTIHPRRPLPIVPDRDAATRDDKDSNNN
jgi:hypothetical protein